MSDLDSIAVNIAIRDKLWQSEKKQFMFLDEFIIDLDNMCAFKKNEQYPVIYRVVKTPKNDRKRSRFTNQKPFDISYAYDSVKSSYFLENGGGFYGELWRYKYNENRYPTPR